MIARAVDGPMPGNDSSSARLAVFRLTIADSAPLGTLGVTVGVGTDGVTTTGALTPGRGRAMVVVGVLPRIGM